MHLETVACCGDIADLRTLEYKDGAVRLIDQTKLPGELVYLECRSSQELADAIAQMRIRGAPALGVAAAYAMALGSMEFRPEGASSPDGHRSSFRRHMAKVADLVRATRPTAVNLFGAVDQSLRVVGMVDEVGVPAVQQQLLGLAHRLAEEDVRVNRILGAVGAQLVPERANILTHCNTGSLATVEYGTALGVVRTAFEQGKAIHVLVDETRPYLQGARLTAWELQREGIPFTLITDNMAGHFMARGEVDLVLVGADRIASNGDVANKIGTYSLAVLAREHGIPFYVVAPISSIDLSVASGASIPIEERGQDEVTTIAGIRIAPAGARAAHPAFDITPSRLVSAIVTEAGILRPPYESSIAAAVAAGREPGENLELVR